MERNLPHSSSESDFTQYCEDLEILASERNVSGAWIEQACKITSKVLNTMSAERNALDLPSIELFAKLVSMCPENQNLLQNFAQLVLLHLYDPKLFLKLREILRSRPTTHADESALYVPEWWPENKGNKDTGTITSVLQIASHLHDFVRLHTHDFQLIIHIVSIILSHIQEMTKEPNPSWTCFAALVSMMLRSTAHRDLVSLIICHDEHAINVLLRLSLQSGFTGGQRYAKFMLELLMIRPPVLSLFLFTYQLQGAKRLSIMYSQSQLGAFELAAKTPFRFIIDLLNHTSGSSWFSNSTVISCIAISTQALESFSNANDILPIYEEFNRVSEVNSLLSVCAQFGSVMAQCLLECYGDDLCTSKYFILTSGFTRSALPPIAKPNYFFAEQKALSSNDTLLSLASLDMFDELHRSLLRLLKFLASVLESEIHRKLDVVPDTALTEKLYMRKLQSVFSFIILALKCNEKLESSNLTALVTKKTIFEIGRIILWNEDLILAWTTFFNCATDISYNEINTLHLWYEILKTMCFGYDKEKYSELIRDGFNKYSNTFFPDIKETNVCNSPCVRSPPQPAFAVIAKNEYMFLYDSLSSRKFDYADTSQLKFSGHYNIGGRQQSVHVDKFGKNRV